MATVRSRGNQAAAVTRHLRSLGVVVLPSGTPVTREGVRVSSDITHAATVTVSLSLPSAEARLTDRIVDLVTEAGLYSVHRNPESPSILYLDRKD
jgi:hypothetical protein